MTLVKEFHEKYDQPAPHFPVVPTLEEINLRHRLIEEEFKEVLEELENLRKELRHNNSISGFIIVYQRLLKELADLKYVVDGTAVTWGLPIDAADKAVHQSNMTKSGSKQLGKVTKGDNYEAPDMSTLIHDVIEAEVIHEENSVTLHNKFTINGSDGVVIV